jgi:hypothetical protein
MVFSLFVELNTKASPRINAAAFAGATDPDLKRFRIHHPLPGIQA